MAFDFLTLLFHPPPLQETTTYELLSNDLLGGFSDEMIDKFFRPFYQGESFVGSGEWELGTGEWELVRGKGGGGSG